MSEKRWHPAPLQMWQGIEREQRRVAGRCNALQRREGNCNAPVVTGQVREDAGLRPGCGSVDPQRA